MSNIIKPDQHIGNYVVQKQLDPDSHFVMRQFKRSDVEAVDTIVELAHGERDLVTTESDWKVVEAIIDFFARRWPDEYWEFRRSIPDIRSSRRDGGYSESKEIKYVGALPPRLQKLIKAIFPHQQWDKKFANKFVNRMKVFKVGGA